ncbi:TonB-dependent receptor domain-containing protein [Elizabethkingia anophelis]|uniref:TonB-dependent receptor n=2 Tax=Elizabethkingia anophelis TaxID=1117645 RepID=X5L219_9FLAO|nr:TonB-dependent receptor [Elizabethkingia anophelis]AQW91821.1 TonB-dependent receptor [Elizabethkingia anophelis]AQW96421.1 TonB-dependent receptor [Elizabethkingia anophelis]AQX52127.1 TonB-dependent receptor [Elizabethkingia anophelis]AQX90337.1 TonB-dependent receptor [Elizabethkingia anophelis]ASV79652.1 TonB-dependent receptor [Elizabethkingia anophelis]
MIKTEIKQRIVTRTLGLTLAFSAAAFAFAQQQKVAVSGKITDKNGAAVPYASITFANKADKSLSDGNMTDDKGAFSLNLTPGTYIIEIDAPGFKKTSVEKTVSAPGSLGAIQIVALQGQAAIDSKTQNIQGVTITAQSTKPYKVELDKKTYDVKSDLTSIGGNLQDVLTNVPSVSVDPDGTVSMRGSSNVRFLVNGKPSALLGIDAGANALQAIPADQIDRIEVVTNPSAKYDASGTAGILNIILKKNSKLGFNGSVIGSLGYLPRTNLNTNLSWKKGKVSWFLNGGGGYMESKNKNSNTTTYNSGDLLTSNQNSTGKSKNDTYNASTGLVYDITDHTSVNASGTVRYFDGTSNTPIFYTDNYKDGSTINSSRYSNGSNSNLGFQGDFGLDHKFDDKGQNISLSVSLQRNRMLNNSDVTGYTGNAFSLSNLINSKTVNKSLVGKIDYELPIGEKSMFNAGYKLDHNKNDYNYLVQQKNAGDADYSILDDYTGITHYTETFNAFYLQFKSKIGAFGYQVGVRDEYSNIKIDYPIKDPQNQLWRNDNKTKNYNNLFPSVFLSYDISKNNQFLLNYSRRIDRPRSFFLIPFMSYNDPKNIFRGNPDLNPSYIDSFEFGYNLSNNKFTLNPTLYYRNEKDNVQMLVSPNPDDSTSFTSSPINVGNDQRYGLEINGNYNPFKWWQLMGSIDIFGYKTTGNYLYKNYPDPITGNLIDKNINYDGSGMSARVRLSNTFKIDKTFSFQIQANYRGGQKNASTEQKDMYFVNLGATKTIWKGDGTIAFNIQDIFNTRSRETYAFGPTFVRNSYMQWQPRQFSLSLTYRFKQGEKVDQPKRKKDINNNYDGGDEQGGPM